LNKREKLITNLFPNAITEPRSFEFSTKKKIIFISSRVHPGETAGSFMLNGFLKFLLSEDPRAIELLNNFVFKIVPILNPDGVYRGHYRTDTNGVNLNRVYISPLIGTFPTIFAVKEYLTEV